MTTQTFTLGASTYSPFSSNNAEDNLSRYIPYNDQKSPLSGAFAANGTPGYSTGTGILGTEVKPLTSAGATDSVYRPIMFTSLSMPFTAASSTLQLEIGTSASGSGSSKSPNVGDAATVTWNTTSTASPTSAMQYAISSCTTTDTAVTLYVGFVKTNSNQTTWRRGVSSNTTIAPNGIYVNGTLVTSGSPAWNTTAINATVVWGHVPNHPTSLTATSGSNPGEVNLSWTAPSDVGGFSITGYRIVYKKAGDTTWSVYGTNTKNSPSGTSASATTETVRGLQPGASYDFHIAALNNASNRYNGALVYPDLRPVDYTSTTAHTGQNSNKATATATALSTITPKFGAYNGATFSAITPKVYNGTSFTNGIPYVYDGSKFTRPLQVTGGTVTTYTSGNITYTVRKFTSTDELYIQEAQGGLAVDYIIVGGGGGGGGRYMGGGGGAGGFLSGSTTLTSNTIYPVVVGTGGDGGADASKGINGQDSSFNGLVAKGGGGGGAYRYTSSGDSQGMDGGSGGGNSGYGTLDSYSVSSGTSGQGNSGGQGLTYGGGGGGGAGAAGSNGTASQGGSGGNGVQSSITGTSTYYAGGGGGGSYSSAVSPSGGLGGGGYGAAGPNTTAGGVPGAGTANTGGGGGGANGYGTTGATTVGGAGGSGVVIIRYISSIV